MCNSCDWQEWLEDLEDMISNTQYGYSLEFLESVFDWVIRAQHITDDQKEAVHRIKERR